jgi:hypothetical protein
MAAQRVPQTLRQLAQGLFLGLPRHICWWMALQCGEGVEESLVATLEMGMCGKAGLRCGGEAGRKKSRPWRVELVLVVRFMVSSDGESHGRINNEGQRSPGFDARNTQQGGLQGDEHGSWRRRRLFTCCTILRVVQRVCSRMTRGPVTCSGFCLRPNYAQRAVS